MKYSRGIYAALYAIAGGLIISGMYIAGIGAAEKAHQREEKRPAVEVAAPIRKAEPLPPRKPEHVEASEVVPLSPELQAFTGYEAMKNGVPYSLVLAVMEQESRFTLDADSGDSFGIMQINAIHGPRDIIMEPHENIRIGCWLLGYLYKEYGRWDMALTAYNWGQQAAEREFFQYGIPSSPYSREVMERWKKWSNTIQKVGVVPKD